MSSDEPPPLPSYPPKATSIPVRRTSTRHDQSQPHMPTVTTTEDTHARPASTFYRPHVSPNRASMNRTTPTASVAAPPSPPAPIPIEEQPSSLPPPPIPIEDESTPLPTFSGDVARPASESVIPPPPAGEPPMSPGRKTRHGPRDASGSIHSPLYTNASESDQFSDDDETDESDSDLDDDGAPTIAHRKLDSIGENTIGIAPAAASAAAVSSSAAAAASTSASPSAAPVPSNISRQSTSYPVLSTKSFDFLSPRIVKEGNLKLMGSNAKSWKTRWLRLQGYVLSFFESKETINEPLAELHLNGTFVKEEPEVIYGTPFTFSLTQTQAGQKVFIFQAIDREEMEEWMFLLRQRHSFAPGGLPLRLNPRVHVNMNLNPDDASLRAPAASVASQPINATNISTDAHRKEYSQSSLKGAVSKKKRRFVMEGYDLDLTYITNRIIAMGFPAEGRESVYRNDMSDVQRFFESRHTTVGENGERKLHYMVYNLCSERKYDHAKFNGRVLEFPFDDHNNCHFQDIPFWCRHVADFLNEDERNVVAIHCKAGKGRTGLLICIFLLYCGEWQTASEALRYYAFARTQNQKGVTIASQIRWVHYWEKYLSLSRDGIGLPKLEALQLKRMVFSKTAPKYDFFTSSCHGEICSSKDQVRGIKRIELKDGGYELDFSQCQFVVGTGGPNAEAPFTFLKDFQFEFFKGKLFGGSTRVMSFWLHTQFLALEPNYYLKMERMDIDKVSKGKGIPDFTLELFFEPVYTGKKAIEAANSPGNTGVGGALPPINANVIGEENAEMIQASLTMMLEGRKMTRYMAVPPPADASAVAANASTVPVLNKDKYEQVKKQEIFLFLKDETDEPLSPSSAGAAPASSSTGGDHPRRYTLYWCLDSHSMSTGGSSVPTSVLKSSPQHYEKLNISDITSILIGKQSDIWSRTVATKQAVEDRCFSIRTKTTDPVMGARVESELHLEAYSERQLSLWIEGIKFLLQDFGRPVSEVEGEAMQQSLLALTAGRATGAVAVPPGAVAASAAAAGSPIVPQSPTSASRVMTGGQAPRMRAESFARMPSLKVPVSRTRKIISVINTK